MNKKNWNFSSSKKRQTYSYPKKPQYYYRKKTPKIEFDKDLDYLVQTRDLVISMIEYVLRDE